MAWGATLVADYRLEGHLRSSVAGAPDLELAGSPWFTYVPTNAFGVRRDVAQLPTGAGLRTITPGLVDPQSYSVALAFAPDTTSGYIRVFDTQGAASGSGVYLFDGRVTLMPKAPEDVVIATPGQFIHFVFVKDGPKIRLYADGRKLLEDDDAEHLFAASAAGNWSFLRQEDGSYAPGGRIARVRLFNGALNESEMDSQSGPFWTDAKSSTRSIWSNGRRGRPAAIGASSDKPMEVMSCPRAWPG